MVAIPFSERCAFVQPSWRSSRIESKAGRTLLRRDTDSAGEGGVEVEAFGTPRTVSAVVPFVDERGAEDISARTRWSSWMSSSALS